MKNHNKILNSVISEFKNNDEEKNSSWLLIFSDLLSLMLSFFIIIYMNIVPAEVLWKNIVSSINYKNKLEVIDNIKRIFIEKPVSYDLESPKMTYIMQIIKNHIATHNIIGINIENVESGVSLKMKLSEIVTNKEISNHGEKLLGLISNIISNIGHDFDTIIYINKDIMLDSVKYRYIMDINFVLANFLDKITSKYSISGIRFFSDDHINNEMIFEIIINEKKI